MVMRSHSLLSVPAIVQYRALTYPNCTEATSRPLRETSGYTEVVARTITWGCSHGTASLLWDWWSTTSPMYIRWIVLHRCRSEHIGKHRTGESFSERGKECIDPVSGPPLTVLKLSNRPTKPGVNPAVQSVSRKAKKPCWSAARVVLKRGRRDERNI